MSVQNVEAVLRSYRSERSRRHAMPHATDSSHHHPSAPDQDFDERDAMRAAAAAHPQWKKFLELSRPHVQYQVSGAGKGEEEVTR